MNFCIGLGGNCGDVIATMDRALAALTAAGADVISVSPVYETAPVGQNAGGSFRNAAAVIDLDRSPANFLSLLQQIETDVGRTRGQRWSQRIIDLDLLLAGDRTVESAALMVPHPHLWYRRFVLDPLADVAGDAVHPVFGVTVSQLRTEIMRRPLSVEVAGGCAEDRLAVGSILRRAGFLVHPAASVVESGPLEISFPAEDLSFQKERSLRLDQLPGTLLDAVESVITAVMDEPRRHSRPLRRIP